MYRSKIALISLYIIGCTFSENGINILKEDLTFKISRSNWEDTLNIKSWDYPDNIIYVTDSKKENIYFLDGWKYLYRVNYSTGQVLEKVSRSGQRRFNQGINGISITPSHLIWYNGSNIVIYDTNLSELKDITPDIDSFIQKSYSSTHSCPYNNMYRIDTIDTINGKSIIKFTYCDKFSGELNLSEIY